MRHLHSCRGPALRASSCRTQPASSCRGYGAAACVAEFEALFDHNRGVSMGVQRPAAKKLGMHGALNSAYTRREPDSRRSSGSRHCPATPLPARQVPTALAINGNPVRKHSGKVLLVRHSQRSQFTPAPSSFLVTIATRAPTHATGVRFRCQQSKVWSSGSSAATAYRESYLRCAQQALRRSTEPSSERCLSPCRPPSHPRRHRRHAIAAPGSTGVTHPPVLGDKFATSLRCDKTTISGFDCQVAPFPLSWARCPRAPWRI
jgi:hypothetical protein